MTSHGALPMATNMGRGKKRRSIKRDRKKLKEKKRKEEETKK
jgi:hypothetical protein